MIENERDIWLLGDIHAELRYVHRALTQAERLPRWLVLLGDFDSEQRPLRELLLPLRMDFPSVRIAFIHGNHDADSYEHWANLCDCGDAQPLHGRVVDLGGVRVAGLGGVFGGRVWRPPEAARLRNRNELKAKCGRQRHSPAYLGYIFPDEYEQLASQQADILVLHEAPSCHRYGFAALDELARHMGVKRVFHGHHHDDRTEEYRARWPEMGFETYAVRVRAIRNAAGDLILPSPGDYFMPPD